MTVVHLSKADAQRAGLVPIPVRKPRTTRKAEPRNRAVSRCCGCGETFTTDAAETRHVGLGHYRFETGDFDAI